MSTSNNGIDGLRGNTLHYPARTDYIQKFKPGSVNDTNLKKDAMSPESGMVTTHDIPVSQIDKSDEIYDSKNNNEPMGHLQLTNIASLVNVIKDSQRLIDKSDALTNATTYPTTGSPFPPAPQTHGQLVLRAAETSNVVDAQFLGEILDNFSRVDTNNDRVITATEAMAFIDKNT